MLLFLVLILVLNFDFLRPVSSEPKWSRFLWMVHSWLPRRYSITFIHNLTKFIKHIIIESKCSRLFYPFYQKKLEIAKQSSFSCNISIFYPLTFNTDERRVGIPLIDLAPPYLYGCPNLVPRFPTTYGIIVFSELRWEMFVRFVDIGGSVLNVRG
jgi:hypothetical protein